MLTSYHFPIIVTASAATTPPAAPLGGQDCRGGACQFRVEPPPPILPTLPPIPDFYNLLRNREFCHGKACIGSPFGLHGWPASGAADGFALNCGHLFNDLSKGLEPPSGQNTDGGDSAKGSVSVKDVRDSFLRWCVQRVAYLEKPACPGYADVVRLVGARIRRNSE